MNLHYPFRYETWPEIRVVVHSLQTGLTDEYEALIDTGAQVTLFDASVAEDLEIDLSTAEEFQLSVVGGQAVQARIAPVRLALLQLPELSVELDVVSAPGVGISSGNLIGLDVLTFFDLALSHSQRLGFLGPSQ